jgi:GH25 family lysozyme M1 (1,4-beta-N-acetylmuramidase)
MVVLAAAVGGAQPAASSDSPAPAKTAAADPVSGIDVSAYQGLVDWQAVKTTGVLFAYVRASEQANTPDAAFAANYAGAKAQGLSVGAYHRARPDVSGGRAQADYFLDHAQFTNDGTTLSPVVDMEWPRAGWVSHSGKPLGSCYDMTATQLVSWTRAFLSEVTARTGRLGTIYTSTSWWNLCTGGDRTFGQNPLWVARYSTSPLPLPAGWRNFTFWQYTSSGTLPNGASVDQDVFREDAAALGWLAQGTPVALTNWVDRRYQHVIYVSADGHIHELYSLLRERHWQQNDLTVKVGGAPALRGTALTSWVDQRYQHVAYISVNRHVCELYFPLTGGRWKQRDLTVAAAAPRPGRAVR